MKNTSSYVNSSPGLAGTDDLIKTGQDLNNIFDVVDRALNPQKYPAQPQAPAEQPRQAGFGWGKALLITAAAGSVVYAGKKVYDNQKGKSK